MARHARQNILFNGCFAHVFSRSFENKFIFRSSLDFDTFKTLLLDSRRRFSFMIHHYCLMNTHFHLAVSMPSVESFSDGIAHVKREYTKWFNQIYKRNGPLWRERFKSMVIEDEHYLTACGEYIENNPVKAGMAAKAEDWPHSSSAYYLLNRPDPLVDFYEKEEIPHEIDSSDNSIFTEGLAIGGKLFQMQIREGMFRELPVP